jgi:hypothetical protein
MLTYCQDTAQIDLDRLKLCVRGLKGVIDSIIRVDADDTAADAVEYAEGNDIALGWASDYVAELTTMLARARGIEKE